MINSIFLTRQLLKLTMRFDWKAALTVSVGFSILIALGFWQLDRAEEKRRKQQMIEARLSAKPAAFEEAVQKHSNSLNFQRVALQGIFIKHRSIFLVNKFHLGQMGYEVFTPFKLKAANQVIIISRGWTPSGFDTTILPEIPAPEGETLLTGVIQVPTGRSFFVDQPIRKETWPLRLHHLNMNKISQLFETPLFPFVVRLDKNMPGVLQRYWPVINTNSERSTSYAYQWFAMAFVLLLVTLLNSTNIADVLRRKKKKSKSSADQ